MADGIGPNASDEPMSAATRKISGISFVCARVSQWINASHATIQSEPETHSFYCCGNFHMTATAYSEFLKSEFWIDLSSKCRERDKGACRRCGIQTQTDAHHLFYRTSWFDTQIEDLISLCRTCHEKAHWAQSGGSDPRFYSPQTTRKHIKKEAFLSSRKSKPLSAKELKIRNRYMGKWAVCRSI